MRWRTTTTGQPYTLADLQIKLYRTRGQTDGWRNAQIQQMIQAAEGGGLRAGPRRIARTEYARIDFADSRSHGKLPWDLNGQINARMTNDAAAGRAVKRMFGACFSKGIKAFKADELSGPRTQNWLQIEETHQNITRDGTLLGSSRSVSVAIHFPHVDGLQCTVSYVIQGLETNWPDQKQLHALVIRGAVLALVNQIRGPNRRLRSVLGRQVGTRRVDSRKRPRN